MKKGPYIRRSVPTREEYLARRCGALEGTCGELLQMTEKLFAATVYLDQKCSQALALIMQLDEFEVDFDQRKPH